MRYLELSARIYLWVSSIFYFTLGLAGVATLPDLESFTQNFDEIFGIVLLLGALSSIVGLIPLRFSSNPGGIFSPFSLSIALLGLVAVILSILGFVALMRGYRWRYSRVVWYGIALVAFIMAVDNIFLSFLPESILAAQRSGIPNTLLLFGLLHAIILVTATFLGFKPNSEVES